MPRSTSRSSSSWSGSTDPSETALARRQRTPPMKDAEWADSDEVANPTPYTCTSELAFVPWVEASSLERVAREHVAIQIPSTQPTPEDLSPSKRHKKRVAITDSQKEAASERAGSETTMDKKRPLRRQGLPRDSHPLEELPDRIRICSLRLTVFLDHSICDGNLNWKGGDGGMLIVLRPFKFLVEKGDDIREELARLEKVWKSRSPGITEEADSSIYKTDSYSGFMVNPNTLPQNDLMGLIKDIRCLVAFMDGYITPSLKMGEIDRVYFSDLWFVFTARSLIYMRDKKVPQKVWKVIQRTGGHYHHDTDEGEEEDKRIIRPAGDRSQRGGRNSFVVDCFHLDYDGMRYVQTYTQVYIDYFEDRQPLASLPIVPMRAAEKAGWIDRAAVVARSREFTSCTQPQHKHYVGRHQILRPNGLQLHERDEQVPENAARYPEWIESEVMVDFERALQEMPGWRPGLDELKLFKAVSPTRFRPGTDNDTIWDSKLSAQVTYEEWEKCQRWDKERTGPSEEDDLLLLPDRVFAFVFRTRKWACLKLGRDSDGEEMLREKKCRPEPWNDLQLPDGHKRLVQSLIESHSSKEGPRSLHFDLVRAKGKGVTILLHGVPGVGKTSTAECAAEANNRPLLPITCGDLGTKPREVEKKLEEAFQLAQLWSCVLLLDEADIFLAQRNESDIHRNALVSVFLRVLEYYEGILFLTTNRVGVFDEAFKSRIHLPLYYPPLNWKYTKKIWHTHLLKLDRSGLVDVDVEDILAYAETFFERQSCRGSMIGPVWNGRQIRNAFQSAVALAGYRRGHGEEAGVQRIRIDREHFDRVAKTSSEFNHYIWSIKSATDADKAERMGIRHDSYQVDEMVHLKQHHAAPAPGGGVGGTGGGGGIAFGFSDKLASMAAAQNMNPPLINNNNQFQGFTNAGFQNQQQSVPNNSFFNQQRMMSMQQQHHHFQNQQPTMTNNSFSAQQQSMHPSFPTHQQPNDPSGFPGQQQAMSANFSVQQQPYGQEGIGQQAPYSQP